MLHRQVFVGFVLTEALLGCARVREARTQTTRAHMGRGECVYINERTPPQQPVHPNPRAARCLTCSSLSRSSVPSAPGLYCRSTMSSGSSCGKPTALRLLLFVAKLLLMCHSCVGKPAIFWSVQVRSGSGGWRRDERTGPKTKVSWVLGAYLFFTIVRCFISIVVTYEGRSHKCLAALAVCGVRTVLPGDTEDRKTNCIVTLIATLLSCVPASRALRCAPVPMARPVRLRQSVCVFHCQAPPEVFGAQEDSN